MSKIKIHHTAGNISYYFTEEMKKDRFVFIDETHDENKFQIGTRLDLVEVKNDSAIVHNLYDGDYKQGIEIYMMVKLVEDQYGTDDFYDFVSNISISSVVSSRWIFDYFLEEIKSQEGIK